MATTYKGDNGVDIVHQNNSNGYYNIYTYGANDQVFLTLNKTLVETGSGNDIVKSNIENNNTIYLGSGNDTYTGTGYSYNDNRYDLVYGDSGKDTFNVSTAISEYYGGADNDTFNTVGFWNYFDGGNGTDTISYLRQDSDPDLRGRGIKVDLHESYATSGGSREDTIRNIENVIGTSYDDTLTGSNANNTLQGMNGFDVLKGNDGNDVLMGGNGGDNLFGGDDNDKLTGGKGTDLLNGGSGADTFIFTSAADSKVGSQRDVIDDFSHKAHDQIDLSALGDDLAFIGKDKFSHTAGEIRFDNHIVYADLNGDGSSDFQIKLNNVDALHNNDFIL
jgi:serralysin